MEKDAAEKAKLKEEQKAEQQRITDLLGIYVSQERRRQNLSQEKLGELAGLSTNHISKIERGCGDVKASNLVRICLALGISLDHFLLAYYLEDRPESVSYQKALNRQRTEAEKLEVQEAVNMAIENVYKTRGLK